MRIAIVGAGPAGLYLGILMKRLDRNHEIAIFERNPPDATFGWGIVFSEETLGTLQEADYESYIAITESFVRWDAIDIHHRGRTIHARGQAFSAIARQTLLRLLQDRARQLGIELNFEVEVDDLGALRDADVVVGADGVNSHVRTRRADGFKPTLREYDSKYVWFGTDQVLDAFTFIFKETEHGLLQAHAYPFDADLSTFIVECNKAVWERAGLGEMSEGESIAFCQELFAEELKGHSLLSNRSIWMSFVQVVNDVWHDDNAVLLGDAAHTAHFSIGSGTKLAMESAIALANAFVRRDSIKAALIDYEMERRPIVERFQDAARDSATYFEDARYLMNYEPIQFAFNLLTRSGRIGYANMTQRDEAFTRTLDAYYAGANGPGYPLQVVPPPLFAALDGRDWQFANRFVLSPTAKSGRQDGLPGDRRLEDLVRAATCGCGLVLTEPVAVTSEGRITTQCATLASDRHADAWSHIVAAVHAASDSLVGMQLSHAGPRGSSKPRSIGIDLPLPEEDGWPLLAASAIQYGPGRPTPRSMGRDEMQQVTAQFVNAAHRAVHAGFDLLELNLAQGFLLASFLSPLTNKRTDHYGGEFEGRLAFPLEVVTAVREVWPDQRPLVAKITASDWRRGGNGVGEAVALAKVLKELGCGLLHVAAGQTVADSAGEYGSGFLTGLSNRLRSQVGIPTIVAGYISTMDQANTTVGAGRADLCVIEEEMLQDAGTIR